MPASLKEEIRVKAYPGSVVCPRFQAVAVPGGPPNYSWCPPAGTSFPIDHEEKIRYFVALYNYLFNVNLLLFILSMLH
jgi:hypothetical protein